MEFNGKPVKVLLADDTAIIRRAVSRLLKEKPRVKLLGVAESFSGGSLTGDDPETGRSAA
jgi:DNA-binding NarL/FixJ family response regulator